MCRRFFEHHGSDPEDEFQLLVALLERGLMLLGFKRSFKVNSPSFVTRGKTPSARVSSSTARASERQCSMGR